MGHTAENAYPVDGDTAAALGAQQYPALARLGLGDDYRGATEVTYAVAPGRTLSLALGRDSDAEAAGNVLALLRLTAHLGVA